MTRRLARLALILLAVTPIARGHDQFTPWQMATLRTYVQRLRQTLASGGLTPEAAWALDLSEFTSDDLGHLPDAAAAAEEGVREALRHVCRATYYRRGPVGRLEKRRDLCYLLGSPRATDWLEAFRLLRREPLGEDLDRAVVALGRDERPEVRLVAAKLATSLIVFGRESEGLVATVLAGLTDRHPNVAAACAVQGALDTGDKRVVDRMVACLSDDRALDRRVSPFLRLGTAKKVSEVLRYRLSWMVFMERRARWKWRPTLDRSGEPAHVVLAPDEIRAWWKKNRTAFGFGTPAPQWRRLLDKTLVLDVGTPVVVHTDGGIPLRIHLKEYTEGWRNGRPVTTIETEIESRIDSEWQHAGGLGNPNHHDGFVARTRGTWSTETAEGELACKAAFLPTHTRGRVRMRLTVHAGHMVEHDK